MTTPEQIAKAMRLLESAQASINGAKELLHGNETSFPSPAPILSDPSATTYEQGDQQIVEGTFDGQNMIGPNEKIFPVAPNYASKSKLIEGDRLKLTIMPNGSFLYKQIAPMEREFIKGTLNQEDGHYKVMTDDHTYRVLLASVTYYKGQVGDEVTIVVPQGGKTTWAAIEAIIPL